MRKFEVVIRRETDERVYTMESVTRYEAVVNAIASFISEFRIEGRPYLFYPGQKRGNELEIQTRTLESTDKRRRKRTNLKIYEGATPQAVVGVDNV